MIKKLLTAIAFSLSITCVFAQSTTKDVALYHPQKIEETIGEKYILLPVDSNKKDFGNYLHVWPNPTADNLVQATEGGKTIVTLQAITPDSHARLADSGGAVYNQYFEKGKDELLYFMPLADYQQAKGFINKTFWLKLNKKKVTIIDVQLTPDHNAPLLLIFKNAGGEKGSVKTILSGTNSTVKDKGILFDNQFYTGKPSKKSKD